MAPGTRPQPRPSRVYFIGAGLSASNGYPVGSQLLPRLIGYLSADARAAALPNRYNSILRLHAEASAGVVRQVIERVLRRYLALPLSRAGEVSVAEFYSLAHTLSQAPWFWGSRGPGGRIPRLPTGHSELTLFDDLAAATRSYFRDLFFRRLLPADVDALLGSLRPDADAVVNFNWDEEVDYKLSTGQHDVSYTLDSWRRERAENPKELKHLLLKPHGSVGWYDIGRGIGNELQHLIADRDERLPRVSKRLLAYLEIELPLDMATEDYYGPFECPPVITAPTFLKQFQYVEQQRIWQDVLEVCTHADEFVFLGYALPPDDFLTRAALRSALDRNRKRVRCLVVDAKPPTATFQSVFTGFSAANEMEWRFGAMDTSLPKRIAAQLRHAHVG